MGAAWCRDRAEKAKDSKSPLDRVIVKCVNQMSLAERPISAPAVIQGPAKYPRLHLNTVSSTGSNSPRPNAASEWHDVVLNVPDLPQERKPATAPVPPPRKKRMSVQNKINQEKQKQQVTKKEDEKEASVQKQQVTKKEEDKEVPAPLSKVISSKSSTPAIYLEVDTPESKHRVKSSPMLVAEPEMKPKRNSEGDLLGLPPRSKSSMSLRSASPVSEATAERVEKYMKSCRSFGSLRPEDLMDEIAQAFSDVSSDDSWAGVDDGEHFHPVGGSPPLTPTSQLAAKNSPTRSPNRPEFVLGGEPNKKKKKRKSKKDRDAKKTDSEDTKASDNAKNAVLLPSSPATETQDDPLDVLAPPANFQTDPKSHIQNNKRSSLIKPSQISVQDFLRQANDKSKSSHSPETGKPAGVLPELKLEVPSESLGFSFDFSKGLLPPRSPQIEIPGTPNTPRGLSRCSSPLPALFAAINDSRTPSSSPTQEETLSSWTAAEEDTTSNLLRIMQEYHLTADVIGDKDAKKILEELGIPENLLDELPDISKPQKKSSNKETKTKTLIKIDGIVDDCIKKAGGAEENCNSGLSSMTPSLTELEASLSELLEASAVNDDDSEFAEELQSQVMSPPTTDSIKTNIASETTKKVTSPQTEMLLKTVISQEVPKILPSQHGEISHTENSLHTTKKGLDIETTTIPRTEEETRSNVVALVNAV